MSQQRKSVAATVEIPDAPVKAADAHSLSLYAFTRILSRTYGRWQIARDVSRLDHHNKKLSMEARERLLSKSPACWDQLRRVAFRHRSWRALLAGELLCHMGDRQGLYALLSQYSDRSMHQWYGAALRSTLIKIGPERIISVLDEALDRIETPPLPKEHWSLALSVYSLFALRAMRGALNDQLWYRALKAYVTDFEDLRVCRQVLNMGLNIDELRRNPDLPSQEWRVGSSLAAVRRAAIEMLITVAPERAYDLISHTMRSPAIQVQLTAIYGFRLLRDPRSLVSLQAIASDRRHPLSKDARRAIEAFGGSLSDELTLVRASAATASVPEQLLRPAQDNPDCGNIVLLRPVQEINLEIDIEDTTREGLKISEMKTCEIKTLIEP